MAFYIPVNNMFNERNNRNSLNSRIYDDEDLAYSDFSDNDFKQKPEPLEDYDTEVPNENLNMINLSSNITSDDNKYKESCQGVMELVDKSNIVHATNTEPNINGHHQIKIKKPKNKTLFGFDNYHHNHSQVGIYNTSYHKDNADCKSLQSLNLTDLNEAHQSIITFGLHRKDMEDSCAKKYDDSSNGNEDFNDVSTKTYEEHTLPSMRHKIKGLTQRLFLARQQNSTIEVARHFRNAVLSAPSGRLHFYPPSMIKRVKSISNIYLDIWHRLNFWSQHFKEIEGHFGVATTTYFRFTRWLVKINFMVFFLFLCFIYIPQLTHSSLFDESLTSNTSEFGNYFENTNRCSNSYAEYIKSISVHGQGWQKFLEVAQGTGFLENTMLFYGYYTNLTFWVSKETGSYETSYNMGLAYLLTVGISLLIVFVMIVKNSSRTIKETVMNFDNRAFPLYTNATFSGWDYCINSEKMAFFKQKMIYNDFKATLEKVESKRKREKRTAKEKAQLYLKRSVINLVVLALLGGSFYAIYAATEYLLEEQTENLNGVLLLMISYLPSIVISILNLVVPEIFLVLSKLEEYTHSYATHLTIIRAVFLRLASVWVLILSLYYRLIDEKDKKPFTCSEENKLNVTNHLCCGNTLWYSDKEPVKCWESYVGKQFYKLGILDFVSVILVIFLVKIPRRIIYQHFKNRFWIIAKIGRSKFDLPLQVLDIVYSQTVCWMGMFFTPLLPAITFVKVFVFFFLKKFELLNVAESPQNAYRASRSYSFFQTVLLVSFIVISCLLGYMIGNLQPSMSCGPFRLYSTDDFVMFDVISNEVNTWSEEPRKIIQYFGTVAFFIPAFLILLLTMYYYWAVAFGYKKMEELLKQQLKSEAHDKQYLLARADEIIKKMQHLPDAYN